LWQTNRIRIGDQAHIELRNADQLFVPFARTNTISRMPLYSFPKIWADFPSEEIKFIRNKLEFNQKLKEYFISNLKMSLIVQDSFAQLASTLLAPKISLDFPFKFLSSLTHY